MADLITGARMLCAPLLLCFPVLSPAFYALYLLGGLTDMIDGTVARMTGTASEAGARLDTAADLLFTAICLFRLLPVLPLPGYLLIWAAVIAAVRLGCLLWGCAVQKRFPAEHSPLNRLTGALLFLLPLTLSFLDPRCTGSFVCLLASLSALDEWRRVLAYPHAKK